MTAQTIPQETKPVKKKVKDMTYEEKKKRYPHLSFYIPADLRGTIEEIREYSEKKGGFQVRTADIVRMLLRKGAEVWRANDLD